MSDKQDRAEDAPAADKHPARRRFLGRAATAAVAAPLAGFPMISVAQSPVVLKMQGAWGPNDIFTEMAQQYVTRVNEMAGGRLRLEYLPTGAVVKTFEIMDAVSKGVLDAGHHVSGYWYGKTKVASLFGTGPVSGATPEIGLSWIHAGGGQQLWDKLVAKMNLNVVGFFAMPMPSQPLGWFKSAPPKTAAAMRGFKYRTIGLAADLLQEMGMAVAQLPGGEIVPAMQRGVIDAFEFNNPTSDMRFGAQVLLDGLVPPGAGVLRDRLQQGQVQRAAGRPEGDPEVRRRGGQHRQHRARARQLLEGPAGADRQAQGAGIAHLAGRLQGPARRLGQGDRQAREGGRHVQGGQRLLQGLVAPRRLLPLHERGRLQAGLRARPEDQAADLIGRG
jgi:hypothetical protein